MADRPTAEMTDDPDSLIKAMAATRKSLEHDLRVVRTLLVTPSRLSRKQKMATTKSSAGKRTAKSATSSSRSSGRTSKAKSGVKSGSKGRGTSIAGRALKEVKEIVGEVLAGAATGAVRGAATAAADRVEDVAQAVNKVAKKGNPNAKNGAAKKGGSIVGKKESGGK